MSCMKATLLFSVWFVIGYQAGYTIAYRIFPTTLLLVLLPPVVTACMFTVAILPVSWSHSAIVGRAVKKAVGTGHYLRPFGVSFIVVLPIIIALCAAGTMTVQSSYSGDVIAPGGGLFDVSRAVWNVIMKNSITWLVAGWGSTLLMTTDALRAKRTADPVHWQHTGTELT